MMKKVNKKNIDTKFGIGKFIFFVLFFLVLIAIFFRLLQDTIAVKMIKEDPIFTKAVIYAESGFGKGSSGSTYVYKFVDHGETYRGFLSKSENFKYGDSVFIVYYRKFPYFNCCKDDLNK